MKLLMDTGTMKQELEIGRSKTDYFEKLLNQQLGGG